MIDAALDSEEAKPTSVADDPDRLPRDAESDLDLRADGHETHEATEDVREKGLAFVSSVVSHALAEQARGYADANLQAGAVFYLSCLDTVSSR